MNQGTGGELYSGVCACVHLFHLFIDLFNQ